MKKKWIAVTAISALLVGGSALTISASNDGYELYKSALKNTHTLDSAQALIESTVKVNNEVYQNIEMDASYNLEQGAVQSAIQMGMMDKTENLKITVQDDQFYIENRHETFLIETNKEKAHPHPDKELMKVAETIFDTLTTPLHDDFKIDGNVITVDLTNEDIPTVFRQIGQYIVKKGTGAHENATMSAEKYPFLSQDLSLNVPALTDNIKIENVKMKAVLTKENFIESQTFTMKVSGEDQTGKLQLIEVDVQMDFSNLNQTTLDIVPFNTNIVQTITEFHGAHK